MAQTGPTKLLFVINPVSGGKKKADPETMVRDFFRDRNEAIEIYRMGGQHDAASLKHYIERWQPHCVVAAGGDGTVKLVAGQLLHSGIPLGILPAGSANGMAAELGLPAALEDALQVILEGRQRQIDVIAINEGEICIHLGDIGLNALLVRNFEQRGVRGKLGYALAVIKTLWQRQLMTVQLQHNGTQITRHAFMIVLANARMYGTGAAINPDGDPGDGIFEVVILRRLSVPELLKMLFRHKPFDPEKTEVIPARSVTISTRRKAHFQVDGEYLGKVSEVKAKILPGALGVMVRKG